MKNESAFTECNSNRTSCAHWFSCF